MSVIIVLIALLALQWQAHAATTLLPNGQQCFSASTPTSGGTLGPIFALGTITGGSSYTNGTYTNVPLTGGSGFGALATISVSAGSVAGVTITNPGAHYAGGDTLSAATSTIGGGSGAGFSVPVNSVSTTGTGMIGLLGTITGGTGGTAGTYSNVSLTGGAGSGATATITVSGGAVTSITILNPGTQYAVGDTLSASSGSIGSVTGFSVPVSSVTINSSLAGGQVSMFVPGSTTPKATWQDANQVTANPQPIILDANGCATIYGVGTYRQILQDSLGNVVWDKLTTDTSSQQAPFWAGVATGTANAITITDPGFNATDGSVVNFTALFTNTGATTVNPSSFGAISVLKDTTAGPVGLTGGEIIANNPISLVYRAVDNAFHILNPVVQSASGAVAPLCGATGLKITNGSSPNSIISLTADQIVMQTPAGITINRSNVAVNINITTGTATSTANGMDAESPGNFHFLFIWAIDNGASPAGLASVAVGNGASPTMPSGYTYKCRLGAMFTDGSANLLRTLQLGANAVYVVSPSSNTTVLPQMALTTNANVTFWTAVNAAGAVPPTATRIKAILNAITASLANQSIQIGLAPNANYAAGSFIGSNSSPPCARWDTTTGTQQFAQSIECELTLESTNIYWGVTFGQTSASNNASILAYGWTDKVNAN